MDLRLAVTKVWRRLSRTARAADDPLGYDTSNYAAAVAKMLDDVRSGKTKPAVQAELARVRAAWSRKE